MNFFASRSILLIILFLLSRTSLANTRPVATTTSATTNEDTSVTINLEGTDADGDVLTCALDSTGIHGTATLSGCTATFTPEANYTGTNSYFRYVVNDGTINSRTSTVDVTIVAINDVPSVSDMTETTDEDSSYLSISVIATDADNTTFTFETVGSPSHGSLEVTDNSGTYGVIHYVPESNFNGVDSFTYRAFDGTDYSNEATVNITVNAVNDDITAESGEVNTSFETPVIITLNASDPDGELTYSISTEPSDGELSEVSGNQVTYTPRGGYVGSDRFCYTVTDGSNYAVATISIEVESPVEQSGSLEVDNIEADTQEDESVDITLATTSGETDINFAATSPAYGTVNIAENVATYTPDENFYGTDYFVYYATDGTSTSNAGMITINVGFVNDAPSVENGETTTSENTPVTITLIGNDPDSNELTYINLGSTHGEVEISGDQATFTPDTDFNGTATFQYTALDQYFAVSEEEATITIDVSGTNSAPIADDISLTLVEDTESTIDPDATDPEEDNLSYTVVSGPSHGTTSISDDGIVYTPEADYYGSDSFEYVASDESLDSNTATISLTIKAVTDPVITSLGSIDPSNIHSLPHSTASYVDNRVQILMLRPASDEEKEEMIASIHANEIVYSIEQDPPTDDELEILGEETPTTGLGYYQIEVDPASIGQLQRLALKLTNLSYVEEASYLYLEELATLGETDTETFAEVNNSIAINSDYYAPIYLQGALEYMAAFRQQGNKFLEVKGALLDSGVCANSSFEGSCHYDLPSGISNEFDGHFVSDTSNLNDVTFSVSVEQPEDLPFGLVDLVGHGTTMAMLLAGNSNDENYEMTDMLSTDGWITPGIGSVGSGILGSVKKLKYQITSFLVTLVSYTVEDNQGNYRQQAEFIARNHHFVTEAIGYRNPLTWTLRSTRDTKAAVAVQRAYEKMFRYLSPALHIYAAGNQAVDTDFIPSILPYQLYGSSDLVMGATEPGTLIRGDSVYGSIVDAFAPGTTSTATALGSGTVGLLKAINSSYTATALEGLIKMGADRINNSDTPFLNSAASVLIAAKQTDPDFIPINSKQLFGYWPMYRSSDGGIRGDDGWMRASYDEMHFWTFSGTTLHTQTYARESGSGEEGFGPGASDITSFIPYDENDYFEYNYPKYMNISLENNEAYKLNLEIESSGRLSYTPVLYIAPQGHQQWVIVGDVDHSYNLNYVNGDYDLGPYPKTFRNQYSLSLEYDLATPGRSKKGFPIPLAPSDPIDSIVSYQIRDATLRGNIVFHFPFASLVGQETNTGSGFGMVTLQTNNPNWNEEDNGRQSSCILDLNDEPEWYENHISYTENILDAMGTDNAETPVVYEDSANYTWQNIPMLSGFDVEDAVANGAVNYVDINQTFAYQPVYAAHVEVQFANVTCDIPVRSTYERLDPAEENIHSAAVNYSGGEHYFQAFGIEIEKTGRTTCTTTATFVVEWGFRTEATQWYLDGETGSGYDTYVNRITRTFTEEINWDLASGSFPVDEALQVIAAHVPNFAYRDEENEDGNHPEGFPLFLTHTLFDHLRGPGLYVPSDASSKTIYWVHGIGPMMDDDHVEDTSYYYPSNLNGDMVVKYRRNVP